MQNLQKLTELIVENVYVSFTKVTIIGYQICKTYYKPYIAFLLNNKSSEFLFPGFSLVEKTESSKFQYFLFLYLSRIGMQLFENEEICGENNNHIIKGVRNTSQELFVFVDMTQCKLKSDGFFSRNADKYLFVLPDEILNLHHCCNIPIHASVETFFLEFPDILELTDSSGNQVESPVVLYSGTHEKNLSFRHTFGEPLSMHEVYGWVFRFTDFTHAIRKGGWSDDNRPEYKYNRCITEKNSGKYLKGGIVRYVVFLGNSLFLTEATPVDLQEEYSSILCMHEYFVKNYNFQLPLTYHFIDKATLNDNFDSSCLLYQII